MKKTLLIKCAFMIGLSLCIGNSALGQNKKHRVYKKKAVVKQKKHVHRHARPYRYAHHPRCGVTVRVRPAGGRIVAYRGVNYHFHNGVWYKPRGNKFVVFRPFAGIRIKVLPPSCFAFTLRAKKYHYYYGTYYVYIPEAQEYEVVAAPEGAQVDTLPDDCTGPP